MKKGTVRLLLLVFSIQSIAWLAGGCASKDPADSSIPWGRPAGWEDQGPGMGF